MEKVARIRHRGVQRGVPDLCRVLVGGSGAARYRGLLARIGALEMTSLETLSKTLDSIR